MHGILVALALLLGVSARDPTTCPERVLPVPGYTTAWLAPLSYFKCPNASNIPDKAYLTQYSAEYPTRADSWTQNCSDSYIWADGTSQAGDFNSYCCSSDQIKTWILSTTPSGYLGEISALCDDANQTVLPFIRSGWNDTSTCSNALDDAEKQTDPHYGSDQNAGIYTLRTVAETYQFLGVGTNVDAYQYTFQCPPGLRPIGFGARSACYSLKDIKVLCAASDNSTTGLAPGLNRERKNCTNTGLKPATDPIGEPGPWLWEGSGIFNPSRSSPYYSAQAGDPQSDCCNVGRIEKWYLVNATDARFSNYSLGQISATCSDGTVLSPITFGHNGTNIDCKLIRLFLNGGRTVATPADGNFPYMTSDTDGVPHLVQSFLTSNPSEAKVFQCPNDTQPIGYSAAPACLGLTQLQVLCGNPIDSIPAPAPAPTPSSTTLPISQSSHQKDSSALSGGAIAGIVIGVLAGLGFAVFLLFFAHRMLRQRRPESPDKTMELRDSGRSWSGKDRGSSMLTHPAHDSPPLNSEASTALGPQAFDLTAVPFSAAQRITDGVGISSIWVPLSNSTSFRGLPSSWEIPLANVKLICSGGRPVELGRGGFGIVLRAKVWNGEAAIKMIKGGSAAEHARLLHEIKILESCRSTQIVQFLGYSITSDGLLLCMEFMPNGTLFSALGKSPEFQWYNRGRQAMLDVTAGLFFLHSRKLSHNDLKTPNVLIGGDMRVKIADLGLGKLVNGINTQVSQFGTFAYLSPEFLTHGVCGLPSDIWAFSTILIEVCTLRRPTRGMQANDITVPDQAPAALVSLIRDCRAESPEDRPTVEEICERLEAVK